MMVIMMLPALLLLLAASAQCAVLDPALYLVPSPPLVQGVDSVPPAELWGRSLEERSRVKIGEDGNVAPPTDKPPTIASRMFWPRFRSSEPVIDVQVPLTFSLSGSYGKVAVPSGVIANTYTNVVGVGSNGNSNLSAGSNMGGIPNLSPTRSNIFGSAVATVYGHYGRSALAGSSYGNYGGVRVFGSDNVASWSGWGNGKWGHYGKG